MIEMELTPRERELVHPWIERLHERAGHRGDGDVTFTDEAIVGHKIGGPGKFRITRYHLELIVEWARATHMDTAFTVDELALLRRIRVALGKE